MEIVAGSDIIWEQTLERLVKQFQTELHWMYFPFLHDTELAGGAVQETYFKVYQFLDSFRGDSEEKTWLLRIAINTCRDMHRSTWFRHMDRRMTPVILLATLAKLKTEKKDILQAVMMLSLGRGSH